MIKAVEQGRNLIITVGAGDDDSAIDITVKPLPAKVGMGLMALWTGIFFGETEQPETDADRYSRLAVGEENWAVIENDLRWEEMKDVINVAFFWNVPGGGIDLVNEMLRDGYPKAQESLLKSNGLWESVSLLRTWLDGVSASPTPEPAATPDTATPTGTSDSSTATVDRLPMAKRSINQNAT